MLLKGKHALERARQIMKVLSTSQTSGALKRSAMALSEAEATTLIFLFERLSYTVRDAKTPQESVYVSLLHSDGSDFWPELLDLISMDVEAHLCALSAPDSSCLAIANYLQTDPLQLAFQSECLDRDPSQQLFWAQNLQSDATILHEQLKELGLKFGFRNDPPPLLDLIDLAGPDPSTEEGLLESLICPEDSQRNLCQLDTVRENLTQWLRRYRGAVLRAAREQFEVPAGWDPGDFGIGLWPESPINVPDGLLRWLWCCRDEILDMIEQTSEPESCLRYSQLILTNAERGLLANKVPVPSSLNVNPSSVYDADAQLAKLINAVSQLFPHVGDESQETSGQEGADAAAITCKTHGSSGPRFSSQKRWKVAEVQEHCELTMKSNDPTKIQTYLFVAGKKLAEQIGCDPKTLAATEFWQQRKAGQAKWRQQNTAGLPPRKRDSE